MYKIELSPMATREFKKLTPKVQKDIANEIDGLASTPLPDGCKKLKGVSNKIKNKFGSDCIYRIKCNDYRIIYSVVDDMVTIFILKIGARKEVYDFLKKGL